MSGPHRAFAVRAITAAAIAYSLLHFYQSGVRYPLADPFLGKFDEQLPPLVEHLRTGNPVHVNSPVQYGPVFFFLMHPVLRLTSGDTAALSALLYALQLACVAGAFVLTCAALRRAGFSAGGLTITWLAVLWLNFSPLYTTMATRSVETWELLLMAAALYAVTSARPWIAAAAIAAAGLVKLLPFLVVYYWLVTDRRMFARAVAALTVLLAAGQSLYGPEMGFGYPASRTGGTFGFSYGMTWHENIAPKAAFAKLFGHLNVPPGYWIDLTPAQLTAAIVLGDLLVLALMAWLTIALARASAPRSLARIVWDWSFLAVAMLVLSPNTTMEYAPLALGAVTYGLVRLLDERATAERTTWAAFLAGLFFLGAIVPRSVLHRLTLVPALQRATGNTHLSVPEAYQYFCFPLAGLVLVGWAIWRMKPDREPAGSGASGGMHDTTLVRRVVVRLFVCAAGLALVVALVVSGLPRTRGGHAANVEAWRRAAEQGDSRAQRDLGIAYACGDGIARDDAAAAVWLRRAADQGSADAQLDLATLYLWGRGVVRDRVAWQAWAEKAAAQGLRRAMRHAAASYAAGNASASDDAIAIGWYRKAVDAGDTAAVALVRDREARRVDVRGRLDAAGVYALSDLYFRGLSVPQSNRDGYRLLAVAAARFVSERAAAVWDPAGCLGR